MRYIFLVDYLLLPLYLAFFIWRARKMAKKPESRNLQKYLYLAFALRMIGSIAYSMLIEYYYGYGDTFTFYQGGNFFTEQINKAPSNIYYLFSSFKETSDWYNSITITNGYFDTPSNNMIMRISAILSYLCFNKYIIISLFFGFFSFAGQWKLFLVFDEINKHRNRKLLGLAVLFSPSIWFWGSGLLKDSICLGSMGFIVYILYQFFAKKNFSLKNLVALLFLTYITFVIKSYIIVIFCVGLLVMAFFYFLRSIKSRIVKVVLVLLMTGMTGIVLYAMNFTELIGNMAEDSISQIKQFQESYQISQEADERSQAGFEMGEMDGSLGSLIAKSPAVVLTVLFRPFVWESRKIIILFTAMEATLLLLFTLFVLLKMRVIRFFTTIFNTPHLMFCFTISVLFALIIGFTTFNFGTIVRYKIIFLPFFYFGLVNLYSMYTHRKTNTIPEPLVSGKK